MLSNILHRYAIHMSQSIALSTALIHNVAICAVTNPIIFSKEGAIA